MSAKQKRRVGGVEYEGSTPLDETLKIALDADKEITQLKALNAELLEALEAALKIADSWVHDQYDGTSMLKGALKELKPLKDIAAKARN